MDRNKALKCLIGCISILERFHMSITIAQDIINVIVENDLQQYPI